MATQMNRAQEMLFGSEGLRVSNFKMFPGFSREPSAEQVAGEFVKMLQQLERGEFEVVAGVDD